MGIGIYTYLDCPSTLAASSGNSSTVYFVSSIRVFNDTDNPENRASALSTAPVSVVIPIGDTLIDTSAVMCEKFNGIINGSMFHGSSDFVFDDCGSLGL